MAHLSFVLCAEPPPHSSTRTTNAPRCLHSTLYGSEKNVLSDFVDSNVACRHLARGNPARGPLHVQRLILDTAGRETTHHQYWNRAYMSRHDATDGAWNRLFNLSTQMLYRVLGNDALCQLLSRMLLWGISCRHGFLRATKTRWTSCLPPRTRLHLHCASQNESLYSFFSRLFIFSVLVSLLSFLRIV